MPGVLIAFAVSALGFFLCVPIACKERVAVYPQEATEERQPVISSIETLALSGDRLFQSSADRVGSEIICVNYSSTLRPLERIMAFLPAATKLILPWIHRVPKLTLYDSSFTGGHVPP
jgi:hypothetical protein